MTDNDSCSSQADPAGSLDSELTTENRSDEPKTAPVVLSQKQRRALLKRERRKRKRQALAQTRGTDLSQNEDNQTGEEEDEKIGEEQGERLHQEWLERERIAQEEFRLKREKEEAAQKRKEEEEKRIREEWEEHQRKDKEEQEQKDQERKEREEAVQKMLDQAEMQLENGGPWKNPDAPKDYGTEKDKANCPFFLKTGACRFGDRCSRKHEHQSSSTTLMVRGMFVTFGMEQIRRDDYDTDASLEYSEEEVHQQFLEFFEDVLPEFRNAGRVVQFKVSCNFELHLRGNVYVQYDTEEQCKEAFMMFNGRWYAGRQLRCEFSPVTRWKTAICGLFDRQKCPKGKHCNFLHVFRNPGNEFWEADRDLHMSPDRGGGGFSSRHFGSRDGMWSQRGNSPDRSQRRRTDRRSHSRERFNYSKRRSRSRERRSRSRERRSRSREGRNHSRERRSRSRERYNQNRKRQSHSRTRERRMSQQSLLKRQRSEREQSKRSRSRSQSKDKECTLAEKRTKSDSPEIVSKNGSVKSHRHHRKSKSPENTETDRTIAPHRHKHSKKSKKKSKKKHKRKKSKSRSPSSSAGSDPEDPGNEERDVTPSEKVEVSTEAPAVASSTCSPEDTAEIQTLEQCQREDEIHVVLLDSVNSQISQQSGSIT
ncbi:U2 small nuclear ribonucleoprotein auxiliary factor 35 kDa subunit-related protein 2 [Triplophysa rosa]|uniref:U2 small nuclear ribonucleoprotein auxiliary factor 35 kDa subunit-related protein 2 n=1 Tax=Triplophysa rosa TaxID=992332 RepID=A0A9W7TDT2_TRIRA|nr:U2 small nuclear ribonucleoprotein auxiliary factor 35 kDa subunit-related protein 2 [Triplophysa rosa]KAI7795477.1 putative U2 small nuclear ribonucleoprotein auxiliary factor 35 kDa subunit-related protein 2 [Triplophysa rosa]